MNARAEVVGRGLIHAALVWVFAVVFFVALWAVSDLVGAVPGSPSALPGIAVLALVAAFVGVSLGGYLGSSTWQRTLRRRDLADREAPDE